MVNQPANTDSLEKPNGIHGVDIYEVKVDDSELLLNTIRELFIKAAIDGDLTIEKMLRFPEGSTILLNRSHLETLIQNLIKAKQLEAYRKGYADCVSKVVTARKTDADYLFIGDLFANETKLQEDFEQALDALKEELTDGR
jgi:hypothetical protein